MTRYRKIGGDRIDLDERDRQLRAETRRTVAKIKILRDALMQGDTSRVRDFEMACRHLGHLEWDEHLSNSRSRKASASGKQGGAPRSLELAKAIAEIEATPKGKRSERIEALASEMEITPESLRTMFYRR